jgi:hypothetical protein
MHRPAGFSSFALEAKPIGDGLPEKYSQELLAAVNGYSASYYKLLGDGALVIYDRPTPRRGSMPGPFQASPGSGAEVAKKHDSRCALAGALTLDTLYKYEIFENARLEVPGLCRYGINIAFRLQSIAGPRELLGRRRGSAFRIRRPAVGTGRKPPRKSIKGIRDEDYEGLW